MGCLDDALRVHGQPAVFNTDQGSQFTRVAFTGGLRDAGIDISMDGRGRALDNIFVERLWRTVKYEDVYIKGYASLPGHYPPENPSKRSTIPKQRRHDQCDICLDTYRQGA